MSFKKSLLNVKSLEKRHWFKKASVCTTVNPRPVFIPAQKLTVSVAYQLSVIAPPLISAIVIGPKNPYQSDTTLSAAQQEACRETCFVHIREFQRASESFVKNWNRATVSLKHL